jgi:negative regulator of sigma E activity
MTSIEWLIEAFEHSILTHEQVMQTIGLFEQAKEMHYKETMEAMQKGMELQEKENNRIGFRERNGLLPQQEISDEMIDNKAKQINLKFGGSFAHGFILGVQWYREQLKQL